jgi:chaperonin GroES
MLAESLELTSKSMSLKPLNDRIVVQPAEAETRTASGLVLPDSALEKPQKGVVLAVGPGKKLDNGALVVPDVSVGDTVLYGKYSGTEVQLGGKEFVILRAEDVLGVLMGSKTAAPKKSSAKTSSVKKAKPAMKKVAKPSKPVAKSTSVKKPAVRAKPAARPKKAAPSKTTKKGKK